MLILIHDSDLLKIFSLQWDSLLGFGTHLGHGNVRTGMAWIELCLVLHCRYYDQLEG